MLIKSPYLRDRDQLQMDVCDPPKRAKIVCVGEGSICAPLAAEYLAFLAKCNKIKIFLKLWCLRISLYTEAKVLSAETADFKRVNASAMVDPAKGVEQNRAAVFEKHLVGLEANLNDV